MQLHFKNEYNTGGIFSSKSGILVKVKNILAVQAANLYPWLSVFIGAMN